MAVLSSREVEDKIKDLEGWEVSGNEIRKVYEMKNFIDSIGFVNKVAILAEKADHHPDILIKYSKVSISLSTHSEGGITEKDFNLASQVDEI